MKIQSVYSPSHIGFESDDIIILNCSTGEKTQYDEKKYYFLKGDDGSVLEFGMHISGRLLSLTTVSLPAFEEKPVPSISCPVEPGLPVFDVPTKEFRSSERFVDIHAVPLRVLQDEQYICIQTSGDKVASAVGVDGLTFGFCPQKSLAIIRIYRAILSACYVALPWS